MKINSDEAFLLNTKKEPILKKEDIEVEITFKDFLNENNFGYNEEEAGRVFSFISKFTVGHPNHDRPLSIQTEHDPLEWLYFCPDRLILTQSNTSETGPHPWVHVKVGKFECIIYEDQSVPKYTNKKNESFNDLIQEILFPDSYGSQF